MATKQVCAWCNVKLSPAEETATAGDLVSHGICPACYEIQLKKMAVQIKLLKSAQ